MHFKKEFILPVKSIWKQCKSHLSINTESLPWRKVLISQSNSIFENLALEEWIYENTNFDEAEYLLMWKNRPAIVFGRHQIPWLEANVPFAREEGIDLARRASGGGTVYHDEGNLNLSFLMSRKRYNRRNNLDLIVEAMIRRWDIDLSVNTRDDIMLERFFKVSGTAARLGREQSFHHCTLLINVNQGMLIKCLDSLMLGVASKATKSFPSSVMNLKDKVADLTFENLVEVIGKHYLGCFYENENRTSFEYVNPIDNEKFPGVENIATRLRSWQWVFGKTPTFCVQRTFAGTAFKEPCTLHILMNSDKGMLTSLSIDLESENTNDKLNSVLRSSQSFYNNYANELKLSPQSISEMQQKYSEFISENFLGSLDETEIAKWISGCLELCLKFV